MTRSDPGTAISSASDTRSTWRPRVSLLHELLMRRSEDSLETVEVESSRVVYDPVTVNLGSGSLSVV